MRDARLSQVRWRDLVALSRVEILRELALPLSALGLALLAGAMHCWPLLVLASAVMFMTGLRVTHGAFHRALGLHGRANDLVMLALSMLLGGSMHAIEVTHLRHHRDCLSEDDVEGQIAAHGFWRALVESPRYPLAIHRAAWRHGSPRQRRWIAMELISVAITQVLVWTSELTALKGIALSLYAANALAAMPGIWLVHRGCRHGEASISRSTRSRLVCWLSAGMFHHAEHHAFPGVPTCHLPELARRMDESGWCSLDIGDFLPVARAFIGDPQVSRLMSTAR